MSASRKVVVDSVVLAEEYCMTSLGLSTGALLGLSKEGTDARFLAERLSEIQPLIVAAFQVARRHPEEFKEFLPGVVTLTKAPWTP